MVWAPKGLFQRSGKKLRKFEPRVMRILFLGNNGLGWKILQWLCEQDEEIVGLVIHPPHKQRFGDEIITGSGLKRDRIFDGSQLQDTEVIDTIRALEPDIGVSALFGFILTENLLNIFPEGCVNIHPALLPYNRGANPNIWSIIEGTPAGVTIHFMDKGIDTGDIISQVEVPVEAVDTGESLYRKLMESSFSLFVEAWPAICCKQTNTISQKHETGTHHYLKDVKTIDEIDLNRSYKARDLINILRARTFPPYPGAHFYDGQRKVYLRLQLFYEDQLNEEKS